MHLTQVAAIKQRVLRVDTRRLAPLVPEVLASDDPEAACAELFAAAHSGGAAGGGMASPSALQSA